MMIDEDRKAIRTILWVGMPLLAILALAGWFVVANRPPVVHVLLQKMPNPNGWDDFVAAGQLITPQASRGPYSSTRPIGQWTTKEIGAWLTSATPALRTMQRGLRKECMHPQVYALHSNNFPSYARLRELARISLSAALYYDRTGQPGKAVDSLLDGIEMGAKMQRGGPLIAGLVGVAIEYIPMSHLEPLLPKLTPAELEHVARRMQVISRERVAYSDIILAEGRYNAEVTAYMFGKDRGVATACDWAGWFAPRGTSGVNSVTHSVQFAFTDKTKLINENLDYMKALAKEQRGPYTGRSNIPEPRNSFIFGTIGRSRIPFARNEAYFTLLQTEAALLRYLKDNGRYPTKLSDLSPQYLASAPADPFGGKMLRYCTTDGGKSCILYSVGPDLRDDHGRPISTRNVSSDSRGDIVGGTLSLKP